LGAICDILGHIEQGRKFTYEKHGFLTTIRVVLARLIISKLGKQGMAFFWGKISPIPIILILI